MAAQAPALDLDTAERLALKQGLRMSVADLRDVVALSAGVAAAYARVSALATASEPAPPVVVGRAPEASENPFDAWAWFGEMPGAPDGPLRGCRVGVKDSIAVAGMPLRNGSGVLVHRPRHHATVVSRLLQAGAIIVGKTTCEDLCLSGASHTSRPRPVLNPRDPNRSAGGSSSGNAAAIAAGDVLMAIGGDQGGSVRTPASWCGVVGLKPTFGLVPYTGAFPFDPSLDHLGPMGGSVEDVARLLAVVAGPDRLDARQPADLPTTMPDYQAALIEGPRGLRIGLMREGFARPESDPRVDACVRDAVLRLGREGVRVTDLSIPAHLDAPDLAVPILIEAASGFMLGADALAIGMEGAQSADMIADWGTAWRGSPDRLPDVAKLALILDAGLQGSSRRHYAWAQSLRAGLRAAYDSALANVDLLAMPTTPFTAQPVIGPDGGFAERVEHGLRMEGNTSPFNLSGHPAMSLPCGTVDGLPVGLMLVGRRFDEATVLRAAAAIERGL